MPRNSEKIRRRLQEAALNLYQIRGYDETTTADIAEEAGVTQRTFFRHFPDKREVLFGSEEEFIEVLVNAVRLAPQDQSPLNALLTASRAVSPLFERNRAFSEPRQQIITAHPALIERAQTKSRTVITALASAFHFRGLSERDACLAAKIGMAAFESAVIAWFEDGSIELSQYVEQTLSKLRMLTSLS